MLYEGSGETGVVGGQNTTATIVVEELSGNSDLWVIPSAGGVATQITTHTDLEDGPDWVPDSNRLAFSSERSGIATSGS